MRVEMRIEFPAGIVPEARRHDVPGHPFAVLSGPSHPGLSQRFQFRQAGGDKKVFQEAIDERGDAIFSDRPDVRRPFEFGFIAVRLQAALLREAASIVAHGIASPQDVDTLIRNSFGRRLAVAGVFEVSDIAGWDIIVAAFSSACVS